MRKRFDVVSEINAARLRLGKALLAGKIDLAGMVTKRVGLEDVAQAFDDLKAGEVIRSVILF